MSTCESVHIYHPLSLFTHDVAVLRGKVDSPQRYHIPLKCGCVRNCFGTVCVCVCARMHV